MPVVLIETMNGLPERNNDNGYPSMNGAIYIGKRTLRRPLMLDGEWLAIRR